MRIYRIEKDGEGAFYSGLVADAKDLVERRLGDAAWQEPDPYRHPGPDDLRECLFSVFKQGIHKFGFASMADLIQWFDSEAHRSAMAELGGVVEIYEVPKRYVHQGRWQVIFHEEHAVKVDTIPIPTLT